MKKQFFYAMLAGAAMLASCSSENVVSSSGIEEGADGYLAFNIQLPTTSAATRANDDFSDGDPIPTEYKVANGRLFLFTGASESAATFCGAYELGISSFAEVGTATDACTTEGKVTTKITKPTVATNLYAYVILNHNGQVSAMSPTSATVNGTSITTSTTFEDFSKVILNSIGDLSNGLLMTNAPLSATHGGTAASTGAVTTLATLDAGKIYPTAAQAESDPAGEVHVERGAVKVTVKTNGATGTLVGGTVTYDPATITWALCNENTVYYNTRQFNSAWLPYVAASSGTKSENVTGKPLSATMYRFVGNSAYHADVYRTYWGVDPNYNVKPGESSAPTFKANPGASAITNALSTSVYTYENTFDVNHQTSSNTTLVALAVTFNGGNDFYIANTYGSNNILQTPTAGSGEKVQDYIMTYLKNNDADFKTWYDTKAENRITVTMTNNETNGTATVNTLTATAGADALPASITPALVNAAISFKYFKAGKSYYNVRIQHFGDDETPWKSDNHSTNTVTGVYKTIGTTSLSDEEADNNYLGRYGVLRNNWYTIEVTGIRKIGQPIPGDPSVPTDPTFPETPDDEVENYISVKIHVTPWAKRLQSVVL